MNRDFPFTSRHKLLSAGELRFFHALRRALRGDFLICPKVRLADVITCAPHLWHRGFGGKISQRHADFVVASPDDLRVVCIVELDDKSHRTSERQRSDQFLDAALAAASLPILRVKVTRHYNEVRLRRSLLQALRP